MSPDPDWDAYPRPSLAVDIAVLTVLPDPPRLGVLVVRRQTSYEHGRWDIPGTFVGMNAQATGEQAWEEPIEAVHRALRDKAGVHGLDPELLAVFGTPGRDERGHVVSLAYTARVGHARLTHLIGDHPDVDIAPVTAAEGDLRVDLPDGSSDLPFDHEAIVGRAVAALRDLYDIGLHPTWAPDPADLIADSPFSLTDLRTLYEAILGEEIQRDAFARRFDPGLGDGTHLRPAGRRQTGGRPARVFEKQG